MRKKKICQLVIVQVFSEVRKSGAERMLYSLIQSNPDLAENVYISAFGKEHPYAPEFTRLGAKFRSMDGNAKSLIPLIKFVKYLKTCKPDVIHIHIEQAFILLICISRLIQPKSRIVRTIHGDHRQSGLLKIRRGILMNLAIRIFKVKWIACSSYIADFETKAFGKQINFVENWATIESCDCRKVQELDNFIKENFGTRKRLLLVGNCDLNKNHKEILSNKYVQDNFLVLHIGSTHTADLDEMNLLSKPNIIPLDVESSYGYELCDTVVVPSIKEAMSIVVLEALIRGKEVLVSREWGSWWSLNFESKESEMIDGYWVLERQKNLPKLVERFSPSRGLRQYARIYSE